jgi:pyrroloquinoline quinone biosynthesis protein B
MRRRGFLKTTCAAATWSAFSPRIRDSLGIFPSHDIRTPDDPHVLIKVLGTAQDGGIPHPGCTCPNCLAARRDPARARLVASLAVVDSAKKNFFLVDATPDLRPQLDLALETFGPDPPPLKTCLAGVLLTHAHIGHYTGLMFFGTEALSTAGLPVFASARMADFLTNNGPWSQLVRLGNVELRPLVPGEALLLTERISVTPVLVPHRDEFSDTLGLTIAGPRKKLLYIPDIQSWDAWEKSLREELDKVDFALLDGTFYSPGELPGRDLSALGHPMIEASLHLLKGLPERKKGTVFFTHINHSNSALDPNGEARERIEGEGFDLATDGKIFIL